MLRSQIARAHSKLEIFIDIVDCRQKKSLSFSKSILIDLHFTFFISFISRQNYPPFLSNALQPHAPTASERSCPLFL